MSQLSKEIQNTLRNAFSNVTIYGLGIFFILGILLIISSHAYTVDQIQYQLLEKLGIGLIVSIITTGLIRLFVFQYPEKFENILTKMLRDDVLEEMRNINLSLRKASSSLQAIKDGNINRIYVNRHEASKDIANCILKPEVQEVFLMGISLNDFLYDKKTSLYLAWKKICSILEDNNETRPLSVRVLLIDPYGFGAQVRSVGERDAATSGATFAPNRLKNDVEAAIKLLNSFSNKKFSSGKTLSARVYRLAPTMFIAGTDASIYVQPYYFWRSHDNQVPIPVINYRPGEEKQDLSTPNDYSGSSPNRSNMYIEMRSHFEWIWDNASIDVNDFISFHNNMFKFDRGIDEGAAGTGLISILDRESNKFRMIELLRTCNKRIWIQGVSLKSFCDPVVSEKLYSEILKHIEQDNFDIRMLFLDSTCEQALYRAFREARLSGRTDTLEDFKNSSDGFNDSRLRKESEASINKIKQACNRIRRNNVYKTYRSSPFSFLLIIDDHAFVEQYTYGSGRSTGHDDAILGMEMPILEYYGGNARRRYPHIDVLHTDAATEGRLQTSNIFNLLVDHFEFVWKENL